jgi:hypothetical protein
LRDLFRADPQPLAQPGLAALKGSQLFGQLSQAMVHGADAMPT